MPITYSEIDGVSDPLSADRFEFFFTEIPGGGDADKVKILHAQGSLPSHGVEQISVYMPGGQKRNFRGGSATDSTWTLSFFEDHDGTVTKAFTGWRRSVRDSVTTKGELKQNYAKDVYFFFFKADGSEAIKYRIKNAWPLTVSIPSMSETSGPSSVDVTFSHDGITLEQ